MTATPEAPAAVAGDVYQDALAWLCKANRDFARLLKERADLHHRNASEYESRTGRLAHKDRSAASEAQHILQQFERSLG